MKERQAVIDQEAVAADVAENGLKGAASSTASPSSPARATRSSSAP